MSFGIIYGTTALGLAGRTGWPYERAEQIIKFWATRYPKAFELRNTMLKEAKQTGYLRMLDGGSIYMGKNPSRTQCANYPVQRTALSIMAYAIQYHHASMCAFRDRYPSDFCRMSSTIHDALIDEVANNIRTEVLHIMRDDMIDGYRRVFPDAPPTHRTLVEGGYGPNWGELKEEDLWA